jgi:hypothetical protein
MGEGGTWARGGHGAGFEAEVQLKQGSLCYFDGLTNLEGRHGTRPLSSDGSAHPEDNSRLVLVIRGRTNINYRAFFNKIHSGEVGGGGSSTCKAVENSKGGLVRGWEVGLFE